MTERRARLLKDGKRPRGPVLYWMSREQRSEDNWALLHAQGLARESKAPLAVVFCLVPEFLGATARHYGFMLRGLQEVEEALGRKDIPFLLLPGEPGEVLPPFIRKTRICALVTDFDPLRVKRRWKREVAEKISIPFHEVDAHNIVPCWNASPKQEYGARTIRPKIRRMLADYLHDFPRLKKHPHPWSGRRRPVDWERAVRTLTVDGSVPEVDWLRPGMRAGQRALRRFIEKKLCSYDALRNDPTEEGQSNLSPYLHFGQLAPQRVALAVMGSSMRASCRQAFLEELIVRRELSDNFCFYNPSYDSFEGFPEWARGTLHAHRKDKRPYLYSREDLEHAQTHDHLWNAAQMEMVVRGKMHGYLRMYWAKKILEWTSSPEEALDVAIALNDRYELDGRDPSGYTGIAWSIGGVHDRAWGERPVFGKIRYMSHAGCARKFPVGKYIERIASQRLSLA
jgi:deoxyribodipyrimidine photo-lyase